MPHSRPTAEDQAAARKKRRGKSTGGGLFITLRMAELYRYFAWRYGALLPDDDAGRGDLQFAFHTVGTTKRAAERMAGIASAWAPWLPQQELDTMIERTIANPRRARADTAAAILGITAEVRTLLDLRTIGAIDQTAEDRARLRLEKQRVAKEKVRRAAGALTRAEIRERCKNHPRPWRAAGCDRSTWYRRKKRAAAATAEQMRLAASAIYS